MKIGCLYLLAAVAALSVATPAAARNQRQGINFGTTVRALDSTDRNSGGDGQRKSHTESSGQLVNPYVGYAFGSLNLGVVYMNEASTTNTVEDSEDGQTTTSRKAEETGRG